MKLAIPAKQHRCLDIKGSLVVARRDRRYTELDSLRGLAALAVVGHHYLLLLPQVYAAILPVYDPSAPQTPVSLWWLVFTPLHLLWAGTEAVAFFFVLSGFVLALPFCSGRVSYLPFLAKRICRIYPPYLVAVLSAILIASLVSEKHLTGLSPWFGGIWKTPISWSLLLNEVVLIGNFKNGVFDPVVWSLVHEMRISLVFPLIMLLLVRWNWKVCLSGSVVLAVVGAYVPFGLSVVTLQYVPMFVVGALLAKHREGIAGFGRELSPRAAATLAIAGVLLYTYAWWFFPHSSLVHPAYGVTYGRLLNDAATCSGASIFIVLAISRKEAWAFLRQPILAWLGSISYSVYLFHAVALFSLVYLLYPRVPLIVIWPLALAVTAALASLSYRFVEVPWISVGHRLTGLSVPARSSQEVARPAA